jgi:thymidylate synthase
MNRADELFFAGMHEIKNCGDNDFNQVVRPKYLDGTPAHTMFITQVVEKYDIAAGDLPITTLRPIYIKKAIGEILWIYQDQSNDLDLLRDKYGITWWDEWQNGPDRNIGQRYGATVKRYDLMNKLLEALKEQPYDRGHILDLFQYADLNETKGLRPCAFQTLWSVRGNYLDMTLTQRSSDYLVAGHINKMQYVALMMMVARHCDLEPGRFVHFVQNLHIYDRHIVQMDELMRRYKHEMDNNNGYRSSKPKLILNPDKKDFYDITVDDFELVDYEAVGPQLKFELGI